MSHSRIAATNFSIVEAEYADIIFSMRDQDRTGQKSDRYTNRKTIAFHDGSKMYVTEYLIREGTDYYIDRYHYDWMTSKGETKIKFHSEPHGDPAYQTNTEPFHLHVMDALGLEKRLPNPDHQDLVSILKALRIHFLVGHRK